MDNKNNNTGPLEGNYTHPAPDGGSDVNNASAPACHKEKYPEPPEWTRNIVVSDKPWIPAEEVGNVSVQFNESEKAVVPKDDVSDEKTDTETAPKKELPMWMQIGIIVVAAIVALLLAKHILSVRSNSYDSTTTVNLTTIATVPYAGTVNSTTASNLTTTANQTTLVNDSGDKEEKTTKPDEEKTTSGENNKKDKNQNDPEAKNKIISYFNESSNRVKTEAVKVVKNFEKRTHNGDKLVLPSAIKGVAKSLLESKITDITEPVEYTSYEEITVRYPAPGEKWSSKLTEEDVARATCTENGDEYEITLVLKDCVDPEPGKGTSKAMDCLDVPTVRDTAPPFITAFSAEYYDCIIRCRIEKETGRVVWSSYTTPVIIKVGLDAGFVKFDAEIGLTFEKDYTITY